MRKKAFKEIYFFPDNMKLNYDFNMESTIQRAIYLKSYKSIKLLLQYIFEEENSSDYNNIIMMNFSQILQSENLNINQFFSIKDWATPEIQNQSCSIEKVLVNDKFDAFSEHPFQSMKKRSEEIHSIHEMETEICDMIIERESKQALAQNSQDNINVVVHSYIDFNFLIIGEKLRNNLTSKKSDWIKFDDEYYSSILLESNNIQEFYEQKSVQRIIDVQFQVAKWFWQLQFIFYIVLFFIPFTLTLIRDDHEMNNFLINVCTVPIVFFLAIELTQIAESKLEYFMGWNIFDFLQIVLFFVLYFSEYQVNGMEQEQAWSKPVKIILMILSFIKIVNLLRGFQNIAYFILMLQNCLYDLIPFTFMYLLFVLFFALCFHVLGTVVDDELFNEGCNDMPEFFYLFLMVWRNAVGKLSFARPDRLLETQEPSLIRQVHVELILICYFVQILWMFTLALNFMIGVIELTYSKIDTFKEVHIYKNKAELNMECYSLLKYVCKLEEYRVIVFSVCPDNNESMLHSTQSMRDKFLGELKAMVSKELDKYNYDGLRS